MLLLCRPGWEPSPTKPAAHAVYRDLCEALQVSCGWHRDPNGGRSLTHDRCLQLWVLAGRSAWLAAAGLPWNSRVSPAALRPATKVLNWGFLSTGESWKKVQPGKVLYPAVVCCRLRPAAHTPGRAGGRMSASVRILFKDQS